MNQIKVMSIFGTRPEAIKMAPVIKKLAGEDRISSTTVVTGQHREMLQQVLDLFAINPDYDLQIMQPGQSLTGITTKILQELEGILLEEAPDLVLVHGDTTTFTSALASVYQQLKVGHVEAGLRSYNRYSPYPEEINRRLTGVLADLHFAPTEANQTNLKAENISTGNIFVTGNPVIDALQMVVKEDYTFNQPKLKQINSANSRVILVTAHRRENWGRPIKNLCRALKEIVNICPTVEVVFPVHLNPVVRNKVNLYLADTERIHIINPLNYGEFINLMALSYLVVTDSGGLQEEAPGLNKPVLVVRKTTERKEALEAGTIELVGTKQEKIKEAVLKLLKNEEKYYKMTTAANPYGDGKAAERIVQAILYHFGFAANRPSFSSTS